MITLALLRHSSTLPSIRWHHDGFHPTSLATPSLPPLQAHPSLCSHSVLKLLTGLLLYALHPLSLGKLIPIGSFNYHLFTQIYISGWDLKDTSNKTCPKGN